MRDQRAEGTGRRHCRPPLLVGLGRVNSEPKALAAGTAGPPLVGLGRVNSEPTALVAGTAGLHPLKSPTP